MKAAAVTVGARVLWDHAAILAEVEVIDAAPVWRCRKGGAPERATKRTGAILVRHHDQHRVVPLAQLAPLSALAVLKMADRIADAQRALAEARKHPPRRAVFEAVQKGNADAASDIVRAWEAEVEARRVAVDELCKREIELRVKLEADLLADLGTA